MARTVVTLIPEKIAALFSALQPQDLDQLALAERRRFADVCRHWAGLADRQSLAFRSAAQWVPFASGIVWGLLLGGLGGVIFRGAAVDAYAQGGVVGLVVAVGVLSAIPSLMLWRRVRRGLRPQAGRTLRRQRWQGRVR